MNENKKPQPYEKLRITLAELISNSTPGERLPTEPVLAKHLGVSRATLTRSNAILRKSGFN